MKKHAAHIIILRLTESPLNSIVAIPISLAMNVIKKTVVKIPLSGLPKNSMKKQYYVENVDMN